MDKGEKKKIESQNDEILRKMEIGEYVYIQASSAFLEAKLTSLNLPP